jgi:Zn-dependent M28 family amino/carboxypeptidase
VEGEKVTNLEAQLMGRDTGAAAVIVGAHYDSVVGTVGADDNASGVAAALELARELEGSRLDRPVRFVGFVNEEPPYFQTEQMGSLVYARQLRRDRVPVAAMISLEMLGYYSDRTGSQRYPSGLAWFYPSRGNFLGFVGNSASRGLVRRALRRFRESAGFPSEGLAAPETWPGIGWSDQWSFWKTGYPALMITRSSVKPRPLGLGI